MRLKLRLKLNIFILKILIKNFYRESAYCIDDEMLHILLTFLLVQMK